RLFDRVQCVAVPPRPRQEERERGRSSTESPETEETERVDRLPRNFEWSAEEVQVERIKDREKDELGYGRDEKSRPDHPHDAGGNRRLFAHAGCFLLLSRDCAAQAHVFDRAARFNGG